MAAHEERPKAPGAASWLLAWSQVMRSGGSPGCCHSSEPPASCLTSGSQHPPAAAEDDEAALREGRQQECAWLVSDRTSVPNRNCSHSPSTRGVMPSRERTFGRRCAGATAAAMARSRARSCSTSTAASCATPAACPTWSIHNEVCSAGTWLGVVALVEHAPVWHMACMNVVPRAVS